MRDNYFKIRKGQKMSAGKTRFVKTIKWSLFKYLTFLDNTTPECRYLEIYKNSVQKIELLILLSSSTCSFSQLLSQADWKEEEPQYSIYPEDNSLESNCTIKNEIILLPENSLLKRRLTDTSDSPRCSTAITNGHTNRGCIQEGRSDMFMDPMGNKEKQEDDVESFMKSITFSLKKLSPKKIAQAKMEILSIVTKLEFQEEIFP